MEISLKRGHIVSAYGRLDCSCIHQAPAVQKVDNTMQRINRYPADSVLGFTVKGLNPGVTVDPVV